MSDKEAIEYWRNVALSLQKVIDDFAVFGVLHPSEVLKLKRRIAELEAERDAKIQHSA